jgi:glycosyltransferase involved in cell wall biosynthesis
MSLARAPLRASVVIPTYNRADLVGAAIESALAQTRPPHEVVVVDDGSTDGTAASVGRFGPPVRYLAKPNGGVSSARNVGIAHATGDCIVLLDSDDRLRETWLEKALSLLERDPAVGAACANVVLCDSAGKVLATTDYRPLVEDGVISLPRLFERRISIGSNLCVRAEVLRSVGPFDESLATGEDVDIALRIAAVAPIALVPEPEIVVVTDSRASLSKRVNTGNRLRVLDKFEALHPPLAARHAEALRSARASTALSYAVDLTWARRLPEARQKAALSWHYRRSWAAAMILLKIGLLRLAGKSRGSE